MKPVLIQPIGEVEYAQLDKPVNYTPSFLTGLTNQKKITVRDEHSGKILTEITGLFYQDGGLYATMKDELDLRNRGISFVLKDVMIKEHDENVEPLTAKIKSIDVVRNPRNLDTFLYNSPTVVDNNELLGGDAMAEHGELKEQIGALKIEVNNARKAEESVRKQLQNKTNEYNELKNKYDDISSKYEGYEQKEAQTVESLAEYLAGEDTELLEVYKGMNIDQLKVLKSKQDSQIADEIKNKAKELSVDNEELRTVYEQMTLEQLETIEKTNQEWDQDIIEQYPNDTGLKGAGVGQRNGYNKDGTKKPPEKTPDEKQKEIDENYEKFKETV